MSDKITVGEAIARTLEQYAVSAMYGIISIHNLPIADAVGQRDKIRFVPARGEAGRSPWPTRTGVSLAGRSVDQHRRRRRQRGGGDD